MKAFFAIVYELCLDGACVAKDDPLYETSYIGQAGRNASSPEEALEMRWTEHERGAKNNPREHGLKWALNKYGPDAFSKRVICFLKLASRCLEALEWMNAVEIEEIDCRGGIMRNIEPSAPVWQTFNLTIGGQGDASVRFKALQAEAERVWSRFQRELLSYIEEFGTAYVRNEYVSPSGYKLHQFIHNIRSKRTFLLGENAKERTDWLNTLPGWTWKGGAEGRRLTGAATSKRRNDPVQDAPRRAKKAETLKRKREEHWATLNEVELAEEKYRFERELKYTARKEAKRQAKARGEVPEPKKSPKRRTESQIRGYEKVKADLAALRATLVPKAQQNQLARLRQDGTVAKARQILGEAGRGDEVVEEKKPPLTRAEQLLRAYNKIKADLAALRATLFPKAQRHQVPRYRKDGTVAKAHQILRERSVDAGV
ncbi:MAG: hypothetical protein L7U46_08490 [Candidatus Nanopelagicales bacterium]|nr:hypothetical protein [Candidatus Nanopelagicales bacterium]